MLGHLLSVGLGVEGSLSEQDGLLLRGNTQLVVEGVVPDLLHVVPVGDDTVLNRVLQGENTPLALGRIISGETGLAHAGAIVNDQSGHVLVTHVGCLWVCTCATVLLGSTVSGDLPGRIISG